MIKKKALINKCPGTNVSVEPTLKQEGGTDVVWELICPSCGKSWTLARGTVIKSKYNLKAHNKREVPR